MMKRTTTTDTKRASRKRRRPAPIDDPAWLTDAPDSPELEPPVSTRPAHLPFEKISWEDFERLCRRFAAAEGDIERVWAYGVQGQAQYGIDVLVRHSDGGYSVWQTKRYRSITTTQVKEAVDLFLSHSWATKATTFVLAVACDLNERRVVEALDTARDSLNARSITFKPIDRGMLTDRLRSEPELVDDFFGRAWVQAICPPEALQALGRRISRFDWAQLRRSLRRAYTSWAIAVDPGLPISGLNSAGQIARSAPLEKRYVIPDVLVQSTQSESLEDAGVSTGSPTGSPLTDPDGSVAPAAKGRRTFRAPRVTSQRQAIDQFIRDHSAAIIEGEAGAGKSTFLRALALDILSDAPQFDGIRGVYSDFLPVWISFPLWVRISETRTFPPSLEEVATAFFKALSEDELADRVSRAITAPKTLLLVDGLDEALNPTAANSVCAVLAAFVTANKVPCFITSRPHGLRTAGALSGMWARVTLAPLSVSQRETLTRLWFAVLHDLDTGSDAGKNLRDKLASRHTADFVAALDRNPGIARLTWNPLLLLVLLDLYRHGQVLPHSRFAAIERIVQQLDEQQPQRRAVEALQTTYVRSSTKLRSHILEDLAFALQDGQLRGAITDAADEQAAVTRATQIVLRRQPQLSADEAQEQARAHLLFSEERSGLLVKKASENIGFLHLSIQEFLAARFLLQLSAIQKHDFIRAHATQPRWREPILYLLHLTPNESEVGELVRSIAQASAADVVDQQVRAALLIEAVFADFAHDLAVTRDLAITLLSDVDKLPIGRRQQHLLTQVVDGLSSQTIGYMCRKQLAEWMPNRHGYYRSAVFRIMAEWPRELHEECVGALLRSLAAEEESTRATAAEVLPAFEQSDPSVKTRLLAIAENPPSVDVLAAALHSLGKGWSSDPTVGQLAAAAAECREPGLRLEGIRIRCQRKETSEVDFNHVMSLLDRRSVTDFSDRTILEHFASTSRGTFIAEVHRRIDRSIDRNPHDLKPLTRALLLCDPNDPKVEPALVDMLNADWMVRYVFEEEFPADRIVWTPKLVACVERFATGKDAPLNDYEVFHITRYIRTDLLKQRVIQNLRAGHDFRYWSARALAENWNVDDGEIHQALFDAMKEGPEVIASIATVLPKVVTDRAECRSILLRTLLARPSRVDFLADALRAIGTTSENDEAYQAMNQALSGLGAPLYREGWVRSMIETFPERRDVRELAKSQIVHHHGAISAVAKSYRNDAELMRSLISTLRPLGSEAREIILGALKTVAATDSATFDLLDAARQDAYPAIATEATLAWVEALVARDQFTTTHLGFLLEELQAIGPDMDSRRQAAVSGLAIAGYLDRFAFATDHDGALRVRMAREAFRGSDEPLRVVISRWDEVINALGGEEEAIDRLGLFDSDFPTINPTWPNASRVGELLLREAKGSREYTRARLLGIAQVLPKSSILRDVVRACLISDDHLSYAAQQTAADIFAEQFSDDAALCAEILASFEKQYRYDAAAAALAQLVVRRPDDAIEASLRRHATGKSHSTATHFKLVSALSDASSFVQELERYPGAEKERRDYWGTELWLPAILQRVTKSLDVQQILIEHAGDLDSPSNMSFISVLRQVTGVTDAVRGAAKRVLERSTAKKVDVAFDIVTNGYVVVSHAITEMLGS